MKFVTCLLLVAVALVIFGGCASSPAPVTVTASDGLTSPTTIHEEILFDASPHQLYEALTDGKEFSVVTGAPVPEMSTEAGSSLSAFGGMITGRQIELVSDRRIVQAWRSSGWPAGVYSLVKFEFRAQGSETLLILDHRGFPKGAGPHLLLGWKEHYWDALTAFFKRGKAQAA